MLAGEDVADIASTSTGCTFQSRSYRVMVAGSSFTIFDTAGLNEGDPRTIEKFNAVRQLYKLITSIDGGVSLLLFCMRAPRIKESNIQNWRLFHEIICAEKVPIAIIITGLENEGSMDNWWVGNRDNFEHQGMRPAGHACITATRGKEKGGQYLFAEEYAESKEKVQKLIMKCALRKPWTVPKIQWFAETGILCFKKEIMGKEIFEMMQKCGMSEEDAKELARNMKGV
ncbi:hypothetical protein PAXRUDRAFT_830262 [Paxillus rubicundulus Ve08.2h10]|uniref:G domain-containing protein n=1 Tax=Paxillus rubicundulus Ve08.2h10 TaxID=930991 RepID=A0A0D0DZ38_9AGAM|nr:hypothetical protein PAXRUDRAFT_830262 [Paxillus rubicundulus Ve08.2h10]